MYLCFIVMEMIKRDGKDDNYTLSSNSAKAQHYILVNQIRSIISENIAKTQLLKLSS